MARTASGDKRSGDNEHDRDRQDAQARLQGRVREVELQELGLNEQRP